MCRNFIPERAMTNDEIVFVAGVPGIPGKNGNVLTREFLISLADGINYFWDEQQGRLMGRKIITAEEKALLSKHLINT